MSIKTWPAKERPREKLLLSGAHQLSDAELLAIFLRTGIKGKSAITIAHDLLHHYGDLRRILAASSEELCQQPGIGPSKYVQIQAALELGKRNLLQTMQSQDIIRDPGDTYHYLRQQLRDQPREVFACLFLDTKNAIIAYEELFWGTINRSEVHAREIVRRCLDHNASGIIFCHNHPSGCAEPSTADIELTIYLKKVLANIEVRALDHIIVGDGEVVSLLQRGLF